MELNQVTLPCTDYEESVRFYREMGFRQIVANQPNYARSACSLLLSHYSQGEWTHASIQSVSFDLDRIRPSWL